MDHMCPPGTLFIASTLSSSGMHDSIGIFGGNFVVWQEFWVAGHRPMGLLTWFDNMVGIFCPTHLHQVPILAFSILLSL